MVVFIAAAIFGLLVFSGKIPLGKDNQTEGSQGTVVLWGTVPVANISEALDQFNSENKTFLVKYVQKYPDTFDHDLLEALASGVGPDMFFLPDNLTFRYRTRIITIPYESSPIASFKNNFASAGDVFLTSNGILALPISVDPLVMYYNRSILDANSIVYPPATWEDLAALVPVLTQKDDSRQILKSAVALGQFSNITNAKDIISTLFMQIGNKIISEKDGSFISSLNDSTGKFYPDTVLDFYAGFTDPLKSTYSWNRSLPESQDAFAADKLAFYFGYASELKSLINKNPNLNFLAAPMPQAKNTGFKLTYGRVTGIAVSAFSPNFNTAFSAASLMATGEFASKYASITGTMPVRRDLLSSTKPSDPFSPVFYSSALYAQGWLDPSPSDTDDIFRNMVDGLLSNRMTASDAVKDADAKMNLLLIKQ